MVWKPALARHMVWERALERHRVWGLALVQHMVWERVLERRMVWELELGLLVTPQRESAIFLLLHESVAHILLHGSVSEQPLIQILRSKLSANLSEQLLRDDVRVHLRDDDHVLAISIHRSPLAAF